MADFYSPYYFVPVKARVRRGDLDVNRLRGNEAPAADALGGMRHDCFEKERLSGTVTCTVEAKSPIFVGDERIGDGEVTGFKIRSNPSLPASSLRGLVSSIAETASNSALRVLSREVLGQECYSYRKPMKEALSAIGVLSQNGSGWRIKALCLPTLSYNANGVLDGSLARWSTVFNAGPIFKIYTGNTTMVAGTLRREIAEEAPYGPWTLRTGDRLTKALVPLTWNDVRELVPGGPALSALHIKGQSKRMALSQNEANAGAAQAISVGVFARVLGCYDPGRRDNIPKTKKHELFIPWIPRRQPYLHVPTNVMERFRQLADQMTEDSKNDSSPRPYEPKDTRPGRRKGEELVPQTGDLVFFDVDEDGRNVTEISYSSIWRGRVEYDDGTPANSWSFFRGVDPELLPFNRERTKITLAERVFGFIEEKSGEKQENNLHWKGRVQFSHGISADPIEEMEVVPLKELSGPKPPSPAMYFRVGNGANQPIPKSALQPGTHLPQGRKFYLHHPGAIQANERPWEGNWGDFVPERHVRIKPWPKGSSWTFTITFENLTRLELGMVLYALKPNGGFLHKIGMGKPLGLGSVEITIDDVQIVDRLKRYSAAGWGEARFNGGSLVWQALRDEFRGGMSAEIRDALEKIGDPEALPQNARISYPICNGAQGPGKHYEWFVANEERARHPHQDGIGPQALQPVKRGIGTQAQVEIKALSTIPPSNQH